MKGVKSSQRAMCRMAHSLAGEARYVPTSGVCVLLRLPFVICTCNSWGQQQCRAGNDSGMGVCSAANFFACVAKVCKVWRACNSITFLWPAGGWDCHPSEQQGGRDTFYARGAFQLLCSHRLSSRVLTGVLSSNTAVVPMISTTPLRIFTV